MGALHESAWGASSLAITTNQYQVGFVGAYALWAPSEGVVCWSRGWYRGCWVLPWCFMIMFQNSVTLLHETCIVWSCSVLCMPCSFDTIPRPVVLVPPPRSRRYAAMLWGHLQRLIIAMLSVHCVRLPVPIVAPPSCTTFVCASEHHHDEPVFWVLGFLCSLDDARGSVLVEGLVFWLFRHILCRSCQKPRVDMPLCGELFVRTTPCGVREKPTNRLMCSREGTWLPIRDCAGSLNNCVPRRPELSATDVAAKTIFECLYLVSCWETIGKICHHALGAHTPGVHVSDISRFLCKILSQVAPQFVCQTIRQVISVIWPSPGTLVHDFLRIFRFCRLSRPPKG